MTNMNPVTFVAVKNTGWENSSQKAVTKNSTNKARNMQDNTVEADLLDSTMKLRESQKTNL